MRRVLALPLIAALAVLRLAVAPAAHADQAMTFTPVPPESAVQMQHAMRHGLQSRLPGGHDPSAHVVVHVDAPQTEDLPDTAEGNAVGRILAIMGFAHLASPVGWL